MKKLMQLEEQQSGRIRGEIRGILMTVWDPIGIQDEPACADEYDSYIDGIFGQLTRGTDDNELAEYLGEIVTNRMGLSAATKEAMLPTVRALREIKIRE
jgi:hypothetical protein